MTERGSALRSAPLVRWRGALYLPPPTSWLSGLARQRWVEAHVEGPVWLASKERWSQLQREGEKLTLQEEPSGEARLQPRVSTSADET